MTTDEAFSRISFSRPFVERKNYIGKRNGRDGSVVHISFFRMRRRIDRCIVMGPWTHTSRHRRLEKQKRHHDLSSIRSMTRHITVDIDRASSTRERSFDGLDSKA